MLITDVGCNFGFMSGFTSLYFVELGATSTQIGLAGTIVHVSALPLLFFSKSVIVRTGHIPLVILVFFTQAIQYAGFSIVSSMGYIYMFQALEGFAQGLVMTAVSEYGFSVTPPGMTATVQAVIHIAHFAIGNYFCQIFVNPDPNTFGIFEADTVFLSSFCSQVFKIFQSDFRNYQLFIINRNIYEKFHFSLQIKRLLESKFLNLFSKDGL